MKTVAVVQARLGSTRLPRKVLMPICGKPMIQHVVERAKAIRGVHDIALAVPHGEREAFASIEVDVIEGHPTDVLERYLVAARWLEADVIVRITGDCPLIAPEVCGRVLDALTCRYSYATNETGKSGYPDGLDCQAFRFTLLERAHYEAVTKYDKEHVCPWMEANAYKTRVRTRYRPWPKLSVDTQDDLDRVRRIMARIPAGDYSWKATQEAIRAEGI